MALARTVADSQLPESNPSAALQARGATVKTVPGAYDDAVNEASTQAQAQGWHLDVLRDRVAASLGLSTSSVALLINTETSPPAPA
jgi:hypothetical protein